MVQVGYPFLDCNPLKAGHGGIENLGGGSQPEWEDRIDLEGLVPDHA